MTSEYQQSNKPPVPVTLEQHYRFADLRRLRVVETWPTLIDWQRRRGFPRGKKLGKIRIWSASEIQAWLDKQGSEAA